eukprot:1766778-Prymnesium_polylepis.1
MADSAAIAKKLAEMYTAPKSKANVATAVTSVVTSAPHAPGRARPCSASRPRSAARSARSARRGRTDL